MTSMMFRVRRFCNFLALPGLCGDFLLGEMDGEARGWEPGTALECGNPRTRDSGWPLGIALAEQGSCHSKRI